MSRDWQAVQCALDGVALPPRHVAISVNGTGVPDPFGPGFAGEVGSQLDDELFYWHPAGYPAATVQMGDSVIAGINEVVRIASLYTPSALWTGKLVLTGYSQGAMVVDRVWRDEILNPSGRLANRVNDVIAIVNFGDPMRTPGISRGNEHAGIAVPGRLDGFTTGGIAGPGCLTAAQTPPFLLSCNNPGDLYGTAPVGDSPWTTETGVGHDETLIFNLVQDFNGTNLVALAQEALAILGFDASALGVAGIETSLSVLLGHGGLSLGIPAGGVTEPAHVIALVQAIYNGGMFVVAQQGPHLDYEKYIPAAVDFVTRAGKAAAAVNLR